MAAIKVTSPEQVDPIVPGRVGGPELRRRMSQGELDASVRMYHPGGDDEPQLFEVSMEADAVVSPHAHGEDEIIYVTAGELHLGRQVLGPGASVMIPGRTLYSFRAGPEGLTFLNFRGRRDVTFMTKEEFLADREARAGS